MTQPVRVLTPLHKIGAVLLSAAFIFIALTIQGFGRTEWFGALIVLSVLSGYMLFYTESRFWRRVYLVWLLGIGLMVGVYVAQNILINLYTPPLWDFQVFWLNGRVAAEGLNFYDSHSFYQVAQVYLGTDDILFNQEVLDPAFVYPPPTMFLFAPLGWFNMQTAVILWYALHLSCAAACGVLLWRLFLSDQGIVGLLLVGTLFLAYHPVTLTIIFAQVNFLMLLMVLLFVTDTNRARAGLWLGLGVIVKPILAFLVLYIILKRHYKTLYTMVGTLAVLSLATIAVFGLHNFLPYFLDNPSARLPDWLYSETLFQSLLAVVIRLTVFDFGSGSPFLQPLFLIPAAILTIVTLYLVVVSRAAEEKGFLPVLLLLLLALLLYPHTQIHYAVFLLPMILFIWAKWKPAPAWLRIPVIVGIYALSGGGVFVVILLCWLLAAGLIIRSLCHQRIIVGSSGMMNYQM